MITSNFSNQFKTDFHATLADVYAKRRQNSEWRNQTEKDIVCLGEQYHRQQLQALHAGIVVNTADNAAIAV